MGTKITLPEIGEGIDQVEISEVSINIGDTVNADDVGLIVETEKASMEIPVSTSGIVKEILIKNGELISPGTEIFIIKKSDVNVEEAKHTQVKKEKKSEIPKELISRGGGNTFSSSSSEATKIDKIHIC